MDGLTGFIQACYQADFLSRAMSSPPACVMNVNNTTVVFADTYWLGDSDAYWWCGTPLEPRFLTSRRPEGLGFTGLVT